MKQNLPIYPSTSQSLYFKHKGVIKVGKLAPQVLTLQYHTKFSEIYHKQNQKAFNLYSHFDKKTNIDIANYMQYPKSCKNIYHP